MICDYSTRLPDAVLLKAIDVEYITEALVKLFARVSITKDILLDQGGSFQLQLLGELYRLLNIDSLRNSTYCPQTDALVKWFNQPWHPTEKGHSGRRQGMEYTYPSSFIPQIHWVLPLRIDVQERGYESTRFPM